MPTIWPNWALQPARALVTSTKLKVTGIDLFSAGDFMGGEGTETITLSRSIGGVYKLVIKDDILVGACLYDYADGGAFPTVQNHAIGEIRDHLMFGENAWVTSAIRPRTKP